MNKNSIPVFAINLKSRQDRRIFIQSQFVDKVEFDFKLVEACEHNKGAVGLWSSIRHILTDLVNPVNEYIILCEDDHQFTVAYSKEKLLDCIEEAKERNADILSGGVSGFTSALRVSENLYWVEKFSGLQFTVIFRKFFQTILDATFCNADAADYKLSCLTDNKFFIHPFISIQKEFGYSDVTVGNNAEGHIEKVFKNINEKVDILNSVSAFYKQRLETAGISEMPCKPESIVIPTYVLNLPGRTDRLTHIKKQFAGKDEFEVSIVETCKHKVGAASLWMSIRKIVESAMQKEDDVIIICEDDHEFTTDYDRVSFINSVWQGGMLGCQLLSGGSGGFNLALPVTNSLFWIDAFWCTQFMVIYRSFFESILSGPFAEIDTADGKFSEITSSKMALYPFISVQKDFGYSDVTKKNQMHSGLITKYFRNADKRLRIHKEVWERFSRF